MKPPAIEFFEGPAVPDAPVARGLPQPEDLAPESESPDGRIFAFDDGMVAGFAALWWRDTPCNEGERVAAIGGFGAVDETVTKYLLDAATTMLHGMGFRMVVGPMNGNTWRRYRFVTESNGRGPFLLEPRNPDSYPDWWRAAGFEEIAYYSSSTIALNGQPTVPDALRKRLLRSGVKIRTLDPTRYEEELRSIHSVCLKSFSANFLYTPLSEEAFVGAYSKLKDRIDPDLVRIAERDGVVCGFVFAIADLEAAARGEKPALIIKTLAVDPGARCPGLGSILVDEVQNLGFEKGFSTALHALQHDENTVLRITSRHHGETFRRYTLFAR